MSIQNELDKIKNAVYGNEVRGAIHDGIKKAYDDASEKNNANMEVKMARGLSSTLSERLNIVDATNQETATRLANKATKETVYQIDKRVDGFNDRFDTILTADSEIITNEEIIDARQGKGSLGANLTDLKNDLQEITNVTLSDYRIKPSDLVVGGLIIATGEPTKSKIRIRTTKKYKVKKGTIIGLTSYTNKKMMLGLYDFDTGDYLELTSWLSKDFIADKDYSVIINLSHTNDAEIQEAEIPVFASLLRTINTSLRSELNKHEDEYEKLKNNMITSRSINQEDIGLGGIDASNGKFIDSKIRLRVDEKYKITKGTTVGLLDYSTQMLQLVIYDLKTGDFIKTTGWLYEDFIAESDCLVVILLSKHDNSTINSREIPSFSINVKPILINVEPNPETITKTMLTQELLGDIYNGPISLENNWEKGSMYVGVGSPSKNPSTVRIRTPEFIRVDKGTVISTKDMIHNKMVVFEYALADKRYIKDSNWFGYPYEVQEDCFIKILVGLNDDSEISVTEGNNILLETPKNKNNANDYYFFDDLPNFFKTDEVDTFLDPVNVQSSEIYNKYDELMTAYPHYIKKELLGTDDFLLDIHKYSFTPTTLDSNIHKKKLKILITTGLHGDEKSPVYSVFNMLKKIAENWRLNDTLKFLRFNVEFVVVPLVNPSGFNDHTRETRNGVNINSNFRPYASKETRETETILLMDLLENNQDVDFLIDYHNMYFRDGYLAYAVTDDIEMNDAINKTIQSQTREWQTRYPLFPQEEDHLFGFTDKAFDSTFAHHARLYGVRGVILEFVRQIEWQEVWSQYDELTIKSGTELIFNVMKGLIKTLE